MAKDKLILAVALTCLLDNFQFDQEDFADFDFQEQDIINLMERMKVWIASSIGSRRHTMNKKAVTCPLCGVEIEVRGGQFAHLTMGNHYKREGHKWAKINGRIMNGCLKI